MSKILSFENDAARNQAIRDMAKDRMEKVGQGKSDGPDAVVGLAYLLGKGQLGDCAVNINVLLTAHSSGGPLVAFQNLDGDALDIYKSTGAIADLLQKDPRVKVLIGERDPAEVLGALLKGEEVELRNEFLVIVNEKMYPEPVVIIGDVHLYQFGGYPFLSGMRHADKDGNLPVQINHKVRTDGSGNITEVGATVSIMGSADYVADQEVAFGAVWDEDGVDQVKILGPGFVKIIGITWEQLVERVQQVTGESK